MTESELKPQNRYMLLGLTFHGPWLCYLARVKGKRIKRILPVRRLVHLWNVVVCSIHGHDRTLEGVTQCYDADGMFACSMCCKRLVPEEGKR